MIGKKSPVSEPTFFHLSFRAIYGRVFYAMVDIKFENSYGDCAWFFDNLPYGLAVNHLFYVTFFLAR